MRKTNTTTPLKSTVRTVSVQFYSLIAWMLIIVGGMVAVGGFFVSSLSITDIVSGMSVGLFTIVFGLNMARLLNKDIKQTAPVFWF